MACEFEIIRNHFRRDRRDENLVTGIGDDGAVIRPRAGQDLVVVTDTIIEGRHYPAGLPAADVGYRALAVNLSDIAAMGAEPRFAFLNLSLPSSDDAWLKAFAEGFFELADISGTVLAGGDTTRGETTISVTVVGDVPEGRALLRGGAVAGDLVCVTGTPGDAAAGLELLQSGADRDHPLARRFLRPEPRMAPGLALRGLASAAIDVSDGLIADLGHVLEASGVGARLALEQLPVSEELARYAASPADYVLAGGDDYELCFTLPASQLAQARQADCRVTVIGEITREPGLQIVGVDGEDWQPSRSGWTHF